MEKGCGAEEAGVVGMLRSDDFDGFQGSPTVLAERASKRREQALWAIHQAAADNHTGGTEKMDKRNNRLAPEAQTVLEDFPRAAVPGIGAVHHFLQAVLDSLFHQGVIRYFSRTAQVLGARELIRENQRDQVLGEQIGRAHV